MLLCQLWSARSTIQEMLETTSVIKVATNMEGATHPSYIYCHQKVKYPLLTCYTIKTYSKSPSVIKLATMKNTDDFHNAKEAIMCNHQINTFTVSEDQWNTKDTG